MKTVVVDYRTSVDSINTLISLGYNVIKTPKEPNVMEEISGHPDIVMCKLKNHDSVTKATFRGFLAENGVAGNFIEGNSVLDKEYPLDIAYNCALVGNNLFCNKKYTDKVVLDYCKKNDIKIINIKQGYAKCSICIVSDNAIITTDKNILNAAIKNSVDVLLIENKGIYLKGYNEGFIGGATGLLEKDLLAVNGNIELHNDSKRIKAFCAKYGVKVISLSNGPIYDIGTIIRF